MVKPDQEIMRRGCFMQKNYLIGATILQKHLDGAIRMAAK